MGRMPEDLESSEPAPTMAERLARAEAAATSYKSAQPSVAQVPAEHVEPLDDPYAQRGPRADTATPSAGSYAWAVAVAAAWWVALFWVIVFAFSVLQVVALGAPLLAESNVVGSVLSAALLVPIIPSVILGMRAECLHGRRAAARVFAGSSMFVLMVTLTMMQGLALAFSVVVLIARGVKRLLKAPDRPPSRPDHLGR